MEFREVISIAFQVSIVCMVFAFGLKATPDDLLYLIRRPGLLGRSLFAMFVIMPVVAIALGEMFEFRPTVEIALVALAISPVPPLLPKKETGAGGHAAFGLGLMAILALLSIAVVPAALKLLELFVGRPFMLPTSGIAHVVLRGALAPLAAGMAFRAMLPARAARLEKPLTLFGTVLMLLAVLALLSGTLPAIWALIGDGTLLAMAIFVVTGLGIGHLLGGPDPDHAVVLALSTATRHPAIAYAIASTNFPDQRFGATILLYLIVCAVVGIPYLAFQRRQTAGAVRAA